ncbi:hypothetical protein BMETH_35981512181405, partial [methanotrophic bacterial endosymbiont of Bathymodiolus sp.]
ARQEIGPQKNAKPAGKGNKVK